MDIKFTCQHCKKNLKVPERLAGREGPCPACKKPVKVPKASVPATSSQSGSRTTKAKESEEVIRAREEAERIAAQVLEDDPVEEEEDVSVITLECPLCFEEITLDASLAGKNEQCPECKRIIKVPQLEKKGPKHWKDAAKGPSMAKPGVEVPDDVIDGRAKNVSLEAVQELQDKEDAKKARIRWIIYGSTTAVALVAVLILGSFWFGASSQEEAIEQVLDSVTKEAIAEHKLSADQVAIVHYAAGKFFLQSREMPSVRAEKGDRGAWQQFEASRTYAAGLVKDSQAGGARQNEIPFFLIELANAQIAMGGDNQQVSQRTRVAWEAAGREAGKSLQEIRDAIPWQIEGVRMIAGKLIASGQLQTAQSVSTMVVPQDPFNQPPELLPPKLESNGVEALAIVGLEMLRAGHKKEAQDILTSLVNLYPKIDPNAKTKPRLPPLSPSFATLAFALKTPLPHVPKEELDVERLGKAVAEVWAGNSASGVNEITAPLLRLEALVMMAEAKPNVETLKAAVTKLRELKGQNEEIPVTTSWRLTQVGLKANADADTMNRIIAASSSSDIRAWCQLQYLRQGWSTSENKIDVGALDPLGKKRLAHDFGLMEIARRNQANNEDADDMVDGWTEQQKPLGYAGIALGLTEQ